MTGQKSQTEGPGLGPREQLFGRSADSGSGGRVSEESKKPSSFPEDENGLAVEKSAGLVAGPGWAKLVVRLAVCGSQGVLGLLMKGRRRRPGGGASLTVNAGRAPQPIGA